MLGIMLGGRYKIIEVLAAGGFGQTYVAEDTQRPGSPICVVKHLKHASQNPTFLQMARRLFQTEAQILEKLGRHDQIPHLLAYFEENEEFYLVQEFIAGQPLSEELRNNQLSESQVIALLQDVLGILEFVHTYQVVHRDIKPSNLLRRQQDGKLVLIDFGAVKEVRKQPFEETDQSALTVGIGTQGYMPNEQLAGRPRLCSDIYALGMTAIQALTGLRPHQLPEDPDTSEVVWRDAVGGEAHRAQVSDGLSAILDKMVRYNFRDRYQSVGEVLQSLDSLINPPPVLPPSEPLKKSWYFKLKQRLWERHRGAIVASGIAGLVAIARLSALLQPLELAALDWLFRLRPQEPIDERVVIVGIDDADIQKIGRYPVPDSVIAKLLQKLQALQPEAIGLDLFRDVPFEPGHQELVKTMNSIPNLIGVEDLRVKGVGVSPPPALSKNDRFGFNDIVVDVDGRIRQSLLFANVEGKTHTSFALQLALIYLKSKKITPQPAKENSDYLQLGKAVFQRFEPNDGGYVQVDAQGYQILTNFRGSAGRFRMISLTDVLENRVEASLVRSHIVLIGPTAQSVGDLRYTPYSSSIEASQAIPGVEVHANYISQILSAALEGRPLIHVLSDPIEYLLIFGWSFVGAGLGWQLRSRRWLVASIFLGSISLAGGCYLAFLVGWWLPLVPPLLALVGSGLLTGYPKEDNTQDSLQDLPRKLRGNHGGIAPTPSSPAIAKTQLASSNLLETSLPNAPLDATANEQNTLSSQVVSFKLGAQETTVEGTLAPNQCQSYSLTCTQGQLLTVQAVKGNVNFSVIAPDGQTVGTLTGGSTQWQGLLPSDGDYAVEVSASDSSDYTINFDLSH